jgi:hypothetical protein
MLYYGCCVLIYDRIFYLFTIITKSKNNGVFTTIRYNLEVANAHTFFVGEDGVLVHNGLGSYTITFPDNTRYHGKGNYKRAKKSARRVGRNAGFYPCKNGENYIDWVEWQGAFSDAESFWNEHLRLEDDGGWRSATNHNGTGSPGTPKPPKKPRKRK